MDSHEISSAEVTAAGLMRLAFPSDDNEAIWAFAADEIRSPLRLCLDPHAEVAKCLAGATAKTIDDRASTALAPTSSSPRIESRPGPNTTCRRLANARSASQSRRRPPPHLISPDALPSQHPGRCFGCARSWRRSCKHRGLPKSTYGTAQLACGDSRPRTARESYGDSIAAVRSHMDYSLPHRGRTRRSSRLPTHESRTSLSLLGLPRPESRVTRADAFRRGCRADGSAHTRDSSRRDEPPQAGAEVIGAECSSFSAVEGERSR